MVQAEVLEMVVPWGKQRTFMVIVSLMKMKNMKNEKYEESEESEYNEYEDYHIVIDT